MPQHIGQPETEELEKPSSTEREQVPASVQLMMRDYAAFRWPALNHKGRMARLAAKLGFGHRRVKALYCGEQGTAIRADEYAAVAALHQREIEEANRNEYQALEARLARLEAALFTQDAEFHREQMAALRSAVDGRRGDHESRGPGGFTEAGEG